MGPVNYSALAISSNTTLYSQLIGGVWEDVAVRSGLTIDYTVAGHSAVFHTDTRSLVIVGGHRPNIARFSAHR